MPFSVHLHDRKVPHVDESELVKIWVIAAFLLVSTLITVYSLDPTINEAFPFLAAFSPHLYYIPIMLMALWYPHKKIQFSALIVLVFLISMAIFTFFGMEIDFISSGFNAAIYLWVVAATSMSSSTGRSVQGTFGTPISFKNEQKQTVTERLRELQESDTIIRHSKDYIDSLLRVLYSGTAEERENAQGVLKAIGEPAVPSLIEALDDDRVQMRTAATGTLGMLGDERAVQPLIRCLKDNNRRVRESAAQSLGNIGGPAVGHLVEGLEDPDWHVRMGSAIALRIVGAKEAIPGLIRLLRDETPYVRREAAKSLGRIGDESAIKPLCDALADRESSVRLRAVNALGRIPDARAVRPLQHVLESDDDATVKERAAVALGKIGTGDALEVLQCVHHGGDPEVKRAIEEAIDYIRI